MSHTPIASPPAAPTLLAAAALALFAAAASAQSRDARLFASPFVGYDTSDYFTARYAYACCVADLDRDGDPDIAAVSWPNIARLTVLRNMGAGEFAAPVVYALPRASHEVIAADFDGDAAIDLVAANTGVNHDGTTISYYRNRGDGTFDAPRTFASGSGPLGLAAADFDLDGDNDLAVANWGPLGAGTTVSLLRNYSELGELFGPPTVFPAGVGPHRLVAEDLDGDGAPDLAVANGRLAVSGAARIHVLFNDRDGFAPPLELGGFPSGQSFFPAVAAADLDRDGDADLLYGDAHVDGVARFENLGSRQFAAQPTLSTPAFSGGPNGLAVGDVTGDGWADIVGTLHSNQGWVLWPSTGGADFGAARRYAAAEAPYDVELVDVDGDGDVDPIVLSRDSLEATIHFNPGNGDFAPHRTYPVTSILSFFFDHGDIDADGDLDIVNAGASAFEVLRNRGNGELAPLEVFRPPTPPLDVKLRDLDRDGDLDLVWNERNGPYRWGSAVNDGTGRFTGATMWPVPTCGYFRSEIDAFDLDGDLDLDVVQIESLGCATSGGRIYINENVGGAQFALAEVIEANPNPRSVAAGDFDGDGNTDLAITSQPITILLGRGDLTFTKLDGGAVPAINIATADFNGDTHLDLAVALQRNVAPFVESMVIQLGYGDGDFRPPVTYLGSHSPNLAQISEIVVGDADRDGNLDVMCMNDASNDVSLWRGRGDGTFQRQVRYGAGQGSLDLAFADFTGDGAADLACYYNGFPPLSTGLQVIPGSREVTLCQPNLGFHGPGTAFVSACGGRLAAGATANLLVVHAPPSTAAFLGASLAVAPVPVFGGTWAPNPAILLLPLATGPSGSISVDVPGGGGPRDVFVQLGYLDPRSSGGVGLTNAVQLQLLP